MRHAVQTRISQPLTVTSRAASTWDRHITKFVHSAKPLRNIKRHSTSLENYDQLLQATANHPRFDGMSHDERKAWLDQRVFV